MFGTEYAHCRVLFFAGSSFLRVVGGCGSASCLHLKSATITTNTLGTLMDLEGTASGAVQVPPSPKMPKAQCLMLKSRPLEVVAAIQHSGEYPKPSYGALNFRKRSSTADSTTSILTPDKPCCPNPILVSSLSRCCFNLSRT